MLEMVTVEAIVRSLLALRPALELRNEFARPAALGLGNELAESSLSIRINSFGGGGSGGGSGWWLWVTTPSLESCCERVSTHAASCAKASGEAGSLSSPLDPAAMSRFKPSRSSGALGSSS